ncbi:MAG: 50S ribosomal protein L16, partial [Nanoarchaeota archaeon]
MAMRRSASYTKMKVVPYTRISKKKGKSYIKTVPPQKIVKFSMGSPALYREGKFPHQIILVADEAAQIRNNAMEACRQYLHKKLEEELGGQYLFKVIPFPHHIQIENKMLTAPGADIMQTGMQLSYGKPLAKSALVKK